MWVGLVGEGGKVTKVKAINHFVISHRIFLSYKIRKASVSCLVFKKTSCKWIECKSKSLFFKNRIRIEC